MEVRYYISSYYQKQPLDFIFILTNVIELYYFISLETIGMGLPHLLIITIMSYTAVDLRGNGGTIVENAESVETLGIQNR